jgi:hypothetical protein
MADFEFDTTELDKWEKRVLAIIEDEAPKEFRKIIRQAGNLLRKKVRRNTKKESGELRKSYRTKMKRGNMYEVDVYTNKFYAKMVEEGHAKPDGKGFVSGKWYFRQACEETEKELPAILKQSIRRIGKEMGLGVW